MRFIRTAWRLLLVPFVIIAIVFVLAFFFPLLEKKGKGRWVERLARLALSVLGMRIRIDGEMNRDAFEEKGKGYVVCANHISFADILVLDAVLPCRFIAKKEIAGWPVFGWISKKVGTLFIDRSSKRAVLQIAKMMGDAVNEGTNVLFFPEGTTSDGTGLLPFYANLFEAAVKTEAEIIPITIRYTSRGVQTSEPAYIGEITLFEVIKKIIATPDLEVTATVLAPVSSEGLSRQELCRKVSSVMAESLCVPDATALKEKERNARLQRAKLQTGEERSVI